MQYKVFGKPFPAVSLRMNRGESIYTQSGGMSWMTDGFSMETNTHGGLMKGFGRMFSGDSLFMATYTALQDNQEITMAASMPGEIHTLEISPGRGYIAQKGAFLCAQHSVNLDAVLTKKLSSGMFGGEGFILQRLSGSGIAFLELDGTVCEYDLVPGQRLKIDSGNVAYFEESVRYSIETVKGFKNILFGGEGLFLTVLEGPGKVWLQTMTASELANKIAPYIPVSGN